MFDSLVDLPTDVGGGAPVDPLGDWAWAGIERVESAESAESAESGWAAEPGEWLAGWESQLAGVDDDALAAHAVTLCPGPGLAETLDSIDSSRLSATGRLDFLQACERMAAWTAALPLGALVDHVGRDDVLQALGDDGAHYRQRGEVAELAVVLAQSENLVRDRVWVARELTGRLSDTGDALATGRVSYWHARALAEAVAGLDDDQAATVQARVLAKADGRTLAGFRRACRAAVVAMDADAIGRRHRQAATERSVRWWPTDDGMARLAIDAPAPEVHAMHAALRLLAGPREADDPRALSARMSDALLSLCLTAVAPNDADQEQTVRSGASLPVQAQIVIDLPTMLGLAEHPAVLRGYGPIPAGLARDWLTDATTWARLVTDPVTGQLLDYGPTVRFAPHPLRRFITARDQTCRFPHCRAPAVHAEIDHHPPWKADGTGGHTNPTDTHALCPHHHHLKTHGGWTITHRDHGETLWRSPNGHLITTQTPPTLNPD